MKRYFIRYTVDGRPAEREFASKAEAFRWFNRQCPANEAVLEEEDGGGRRTPGKTLRRKERSGQASCAPATTFLRVPARGDGD